eukprot:Seg3771.1 transcript_id=Seg3771.1/GoldUCD/mRNA.D3Y31 product="hypothetical protein" pseudo=true protein_id=Seg3771.1/GoldUCD/D3Y31
MTPKLRDAMQTKVDKTIIKFNMDREREVSPGEVVQEIFDEDDSERMETLSCPSQKLWISSQESDETCQIAPGLIQHEKTPRKENTCKISQ